MQNTWDDTPYQVIKRLADSNTYVVQSLDGHTTTVYRTDILEAHHLKDVADQFPDVQQHTTPSTDTDSTTTDDSDNLDDFADDIADIGTDLPVEFTNTQDSDDKEPTVSKDEVKVPPLRRSTHQRAEMHKNPHHLPM